MTTDSNDNKKKGGATGGEAKVPDGKKEGVKKIKKLDVDELDNIVGGGGKGGSTDHGVRRDEDTVGH